MLEGLNYSMNNYSGSKKSLPEYNCVEKMWYKLLKDAFIFTKLYV